MKTLAIMGMARSGVAAARLGLKLGYRVFCLDIKPDAPHVEGTEARYGPHPVECLREAELIVVSPGVPARLPVLQQAAALGIPLVGELAFAAEHLDIPLYAISGTNGKSTTTQLLGQLLAQGGKKPFVGGNLGKPLSEAVLEGGYDCGAVEVSSYQMELPGRFHPAGAVILNLTPDHLERHGSMENYAAHKCRLFDQMDPGEAWAIPEEPLLIAASAGKGGRGLWLGKKPGVWLEDGHVGLSEVPDPGEVPFAGFALPGIHNRENLAAALFLANLAGVRRDQVQLSCLTGLAHRMETVATINGMTWINDSKATNVDATLIALAALTTEGQLPAVVLLGGQGKAGSPYELLVNPLKAAVKIICFGASGPEIAAALSCLQPELVPTMAEAVARAAVCSARYVLLTPACASFDEFRNFEHRGECFTAQVHALESSIYGS